LSTISYKLDLVISLVDTTNGRDVAENDVVFYKDGRRLMPERRGASTYILMNAGREDFDLITECRGFYQARTPIRYELMNERAPLAIVFLIPDVGKAGFTPICEVTGKIPKLSAIEAIGLTKPRCCINEYNARRQEMSIFQMEGSRYLEDVYYGILHEQEETYEHIEIESNVDESTMHLKYPLKEPFSVNAPICRIVFGNVEPDGTYRIAMRRISPETPAIVRYQKNGSWYFLKCDFNELSHEALLKAKKFKEPNDREEVDET
jgi:hypothetical protein